MPPALMIDDPNWDGFFSLLSGMVPLPDGAWIVRERIGLRCRSGTRSRWSEQTRWRETAIPAVGPRGCVMGPATGYPRRVRAPMIWLSANRLYCG